MRPLVLLLAATVIACLHAEPAAAQRSRGIDVRSAGRRSPAEERLRRTLQQPIDWKFRDVPLREWAEWVGQTYQIPIVLDRRALESEGIGTDTPVSLNLRGVSLEYAVRAVLRDVSDLTFVIDEGAIRITTKEESENRLVTKLYPVKDLAGYRSRGRVAYDFQPLCDHVQHFTAHPEPGWVDDGGAGTVEGDHITGSLIVSTTAEVHDQIERLLETMRVVRKIR